MGESQSTAPSEVGAYDLEAVRLEWIGRTVATSVGRYPVEHDPIRRYCHMIGDTNPLFVDPEAAQRGPHGRVIAPLPLVPYFAGNGPWPRNAVPTSTPRFTYGVPTPGDRGLNMGTAWSYLAAVGVGDRLRASVVIDDIYAKGVRLDPAAVWIVSRTDIFNQDDYLVVQTRNTLLVHRAKAEVDGAV
jgi:acyl dehydratase